MLYVPVDSSGFEPKQQESKSCVLTNYTMNHFVGGKDSNL